MHVPCARAGGIPAELHCVENCPDGLKAILYSRLGSVLIENKARILLGQFFQDRQCHVAQHGGVFVHQNLPFLRTYVTVTSQVSLLKCLYLAQVGLATCSSLTKSHLHGLCLGSHALCQKPSTLFWLQAMQGTKQVKLK